MTAIHEYDRYFMRLALDCAAQADPHRTRPNPRVGCIATSGGHVIARGFHEVCGGPHAEVVALNGISLPEDATIYVTLEPCAHVGKTPPCVDLLLRLKPKRIVVALEDPNPKVQGKSLTMLRKAGIDVSVGCCAQESLALNEGFHFSMTHPIPFVEMKMAVTANGIVSSHSGKDRLMISRESARAWTQRRRQLFDAIGVGAATLVADKPRLDCRDANSMWGHPDLVVFDSRLQTPLAGPFWEVPHRKVVVVTHLLAPPNRMKELEARGAHVIPVKGEARMGGGEPRVDLEDALKHLHLMGIRSIFVEPGPSLFVALKPWTQRILLLKSKKMTAQGQALPKTPPIFRLVQDFGDDILEEWVSSVLES